MKPPRRWPFSPQSRERITALKRELCWTIRRIQAQKSYTQKQLAFYMGTTASNASLVANARVEELSVNQLFRYLALLKPDFEMLIAI